MTRRVFELRNEANRKRFIDHDTGASAECIVRLHEQMNGFEDGYANIYRYRRLDLFELESLKNSTIFMRRPSTYEDKEDCTPVLDLKEISQFILAKNWPGFDIDELRKRYVKFDEIMANEEFGNKINEIRDIWRVACFTERNNNQIMWEEYSDNKSGICLVYSLIDVLSYVKDHLNTFFLLMPVRYVDDRGSCSELMLNHRDLLAPSSDTMDKYALACMTKKKDKYSVEEEWRLLARREMSCDDIGESFPFINPSSIICGENSLYNSHIYKELESIANQKRINLVKRENA